MPNKISIPLKTTLKDMYAQMQDGEIRLVASALAFSSLLSLVPFIAVILSVFKNLGGLEVLYPKVEAFLLAYVEKGSGTQAISFLQKILQRINAGRVGTMGAIALFFSTIKLIQDMERGVNRVWNVKETRPFYRRVFLSLSLFMLLPFTLAFYIGFRSMDILSPFFRSDLHGLADFAMLFLALFFVYKYVPYMKVKTKSAAYSALFAGALLIGLKSSFTWVASQVFSYSKIYGSLAAVPLLCLWILGIWYLVLGGVAFCASTQKRRWLMETYGFQDGHESLLAQKLPSDPV